MRRTSCLRGQSSGAFLSFRISFTYKETRALPVAFEDRTFFNRMMSTRSVCAFVFLVGVVSIVTGSSFPDDALPFTGTLSKGDTGNEVIIAQNLVNRCPGVVTAISTFGTYDDATQAALVNLQRYHNLNNQDGTFDYQTAMTVLAYYSSDKYVDDRQVPDPYMYKIYVPVHRNRSIEVMASLIAKNGTVVHTFIARAHGHNHVNSTIALNQFTSDGSTPTGLSTMDLNSPEPDPYSYGPYPINRAVQGLKGNAGFLLSNIRSGILVHTGGWPFPPMPNSEGCVHAHPDDIKTIWQKLVEMGVEVRKNPGSSRDYPYKPQGLFAVEEQDPVEW